MTKLLQGLAYATLYLMSLLPFRVFYALADMSYLIVYHALRYRRDVVRRNLATSFPGKDAGELAAIERGFYHWLCD